MRSHIARTLLETTIPYMATIQREEAMKIKVHNLRYNYVIYSITLQTYMVV